MVLYQRNYCLKNTSIGDKVSFDIYSFNKVVSGDQHLLFLYNLFKEPTSFDEAHHRYGIPYSVLEDLRDCFFLIEYVKVKTLSEGILEFSNNPIGNNINLFDLNRISTYSPDQFAIVGIPVDINGEFGGARSGPSLIRDELNILNDSINQTNFCDFDVRKIYDGNSLQVFDLGDIVWLPGEGILAVKHRAEIVFDKLFSNQFRTIMFGGDHSMSIFPIESLAKREQFHIIQFDAHHDLVGYNNEATIVSHANWLCKVIDLSSIKTITQVGLRTIDINDYTQIIDHPKWYLHSSFDIYNYPQLNYFDHIPKDSKVYVTFDVDCFDYGIIEHDTSIPEIGGISYYSALKLLNTIFEKFDVLGLDIVELSPNTVSKGKGQKMVSKLVLNYLFSKCPSISF
ncbi:arginase family protein [Mongoliitalea lutea]|uniref:Agmatinase n=1 Tax=Mongoliitalea lutea TaxID=849756 RepID=A0A8J3CVW3_9BACT|nr:arginase family protein [Mongoliitalea lutea]GHB29041.1 hypothetical protein GCM10008106_07310 [Mongoliitalea lutea]